MRNLAKRIERATRDYFLTHEETNGKYAPQTWDDREKLFNRIQELKPEFATETSTGYHEARKKAVTEFISALLEENCVLASYQPTEIEEEPKPTPLGFDLEDDSDEDLDEDLEKVEADMERMKVDISNKDMAQLKTDIDQAEIDIGQCKVDVKRCHRCKKVVLDLAEEPLD